jgi:hypothetical protein
MVPAESSTHSFIVKIWLEEEATTTLPPFWRGHVTHVGTGERCHVQDAAGMLEFLNRYIKQWEAVPSGGPNPFEPTEPGE